MNIGSKAYNLDRLRTAGFAVPRFILSYPGDTNTFTQIISLLPGVEYFAVRSSVDCEDNSEKSFAGHYYSAIGITKDDLINEISKVIDSYNGRPGSVIIQEFIPCEKAGVLFTDAGNNMTVINSNLGLCTTVVNGSRCDEYVLNRKGGLLQTKIDYEKIGMFFKDGYFNTLKNPLPSLKKKEIKRLYRTTRRIERYFHSPQDIEWCFYKDKIYILQSRPVTKKIFPNQEKIFYDSANISESYSGVVLPLTASYVKELYKNVYQNLLISSGASKRKILKFPWVFENMVELFYGKMYYNMTNWYKMISFMPGYKRNKKNLETMIASNIKEDIERGISPSFFLKAFYPFFLIFKLICFPYTLKHFENRIREILFDFRKLSPSSFDYVKCITLLKDYEKKLLQKWYIAVENDFLTMTYWGILQKYYFQNDMDLKSYRFNAAGTTQVFELQSLASTLREIPDILQAIAQKNKKVFHLETDKYPDIKNRINKYLEQYAGRYANELKLESEPSDNFNYFIQSLQLYINMKTKPDDTTCKPPSGNYVHRIILRRFKKYAANREVFRLLRSNCFNIVRIIYKHIGTILESSRIIDKNSDIFYLTREEVSDYRSIRNIRSVIS
ncbi:MAG: hypothetical protein HY738_22270, partial [Bacteroidia bacterium]|nr:hypothetical protein [Bacteroidia bacterium]